MEEPRCDTSDAPVMLLAMPATGVGLAFSDRQMPVVRCSPNSSTSDRPLENTLGNEPAWMVET